MSKIDDMIKVLKTMPSGTKFFPRDTIKNGYPHKDAARVLQSSRILGVWIIYDPSFDISKGRAKYEIL